MFLNAALSLTKLSNNSCKLCEETVEPRRILSVLSLISRVCCPGLPGVGCGWHPYYLRYGYHGELNGSSMGGSFVLKEKGKFIPRVLIEFTRDWGEMVFTTRNFISHYICKGGLQLS